MDKYIDYCAQCGTSKIYDEEPVIVTRRVPDDVIEATLNGYTCPWCGYKYRLYAPLYDTSDVEHVKEMIANASKELAKAGGD